MTPEQIEQMEAALAESSKKPWSAFTDDSRDRPHTNIIGVVPHTHCVLSLSGHHKSEPNVTLATLAPDMATHIIAQSEQIDALEKRVEAADAMQLDAQMMARMIADSLKTTVMQNVAICPDESRTLNDAFKTLAAYRATGGQDNE